MRKIQIIIILLFPFSWKGYKLVKSRFKKSRHHSKHLLMSSSQRLQSDNFRYLRFLLCHVLTFDHKEQLQNSTFHPEVYIHERADTNITCCPRRRFSFWRRYTDSFLAGTNMALVLLLTNWTIEFEQMSSGIYVNHSLVWKSWNKT